MSDKIAQAEALKVEGNGFFAKKMYEQAIERFESVVDWQVEAVERKWAGLRSFAPDRRPVYGWDAAVGGFAWFAGQGGFGIQTSPAAARLAAQLLTGGARDTMTATLDAALYDPARFT